MNQIVELKDVTVSYRENVALKNISLNIEKGSFVAVIGPNGAGKTTLLTAINGIGNILSGSVKVFGLDINSRIRREIGYVPQSLSIDPRSPISVRDVVMIGRSSKIGLFRYPNRKDIRIIESAIELVGIKELSHRPVGHLSCGEQQKVALARALAQQPDIMLLDEPTSNLDLRSQKEIIDLIDKIYQEKELTIIFVTHILSHIPASCREVIFMKRGCIIWSGGVDKALNEKLLSDLYDCPIKEIKKEYV
ncbi:ABC transporter ATP-binding protein [candidate division WOR-3 bacterium]|nr:ABC transporter ATP-binding protein [candidate division WOR-3 bacterium]